MFAALNTLDGKVIGDCLPLHRHQEFIHFLKRIDQETPKEFELHLIVDHYATHKHPGIERWSRRNPRFHLHLTPTSSSSTHEHRAHVSSFAKCALPIRP